MLEVRIGRSAPSATATARPVAEGWALPGPLLAAAAADGFTGAAGTLCEVFTGQGRVLLVGLGGAAPDEEALRQAGARAAAALAGVAHVALDAHGLSPQAAAGFAAGACLRAWRFDRLRTRHDEDAAKLAAIDLLTDTPDTVEAAWRGASAGVRGALFARDLVAEPGNELTPQDFAARLQALTRHGIAVGILGRAELERQGLGALLAVGQGSVHPPLMAVLRWKGRIKAPPVAFVGKGITFDSGGICIKPAAGMEAMRGDMAGAAAAAGAILALALRHSPTPAIAVLPIAENATGAASYRPGDVLRSFSGKTIEVVDTDAEGRLVLADALAWTARQHKPRAMIDLATLTGSIVTALGHHMAGMFDNDAALAAKVAAAGAAVGEPAWRMPIGEGHRRDLESAIADIRHCLSGRMQPDACHAAAFLREFACGVPWVHLDIAGVASRAEADPLHAVGPTGFGVRLLDRLVAQAFEQG
ncbi:MAG: leucyl aminopeptidase [Acetobacteraceae bacterium]|nr:leucyl aminopeptidase [Acetobacteraceae bacterium]